MFNWHKNNFPHFKISRYKGHVPTVNFQYGETFSNATQKYFNDYRNEVLNSSQSLYARGLIQSITADQMFEFFNILSIF